jgi:hypothetical protein
MKRVPQTTSLVPVIGQAGCCGHLLRGAKGFNAYDRDEKFIGTFTNINTGATALLELALNDETGMQCCTVK